MNLLAFFISLVVYNVINAWVDAITILDKKQPNHLLNGLLFNVLTGIALCFYSDLFSKHTILQYFCFVVSVFCTRQLVFDPILNVFRGRNFFYHSHYTSFYRKPNESIYQTGSFLDKIENFFIDGMINVCSGRKWSYLIPVKPFVWTYNNYLNGKIQLCLYSLLFYISIKTL